MNRNKRAKRVWIFCLAVALIALYFLLHGCVPVATVARMDGFNSQWKGFEAIQGEPAHRTARITVEVIVGELPPGLAATYSHPQGVIRIRGKVVAGKIVVPEAVLGHEVMHALEYQAEGFVNPDSLTEMGY